MMQIGTTGEKFFEARAIDFETAVRYGIFTASRHRDSGAMLPDSDGDVLAFPTFEHGKQVACKYRGRGKKFWQDAGGRKTFWNADALDDAGLVDGTRALIITEGELDAMTAIDCGFPSSVSVPDGAPPAIGGRDPDDLDLVTAAGDQHGKFEFLFNNRDRLSRIKRFILAVDADAPGQRLAAELVRRLGAARCSFVSYPTDGVVPIAGADEMRSCKDLNEVRVHLGIAAVAAVLNEAKPYPVRGVYRLSDYPPASDLETFGVGWDGWSGYLSVFAGEFMVVSGIPGHGKSSWTLNLIHNMAQNHGWRAAIFSPEMRTVPMLRDSFRRMRIGHKPVLSEPASIATADKWIEEHLVFIDADPKGLGADDEPFDADWLLARAEDAVIRHGIRMLVIDPWNEIEHARRHGESMTDYIARTVRALKRFAALYQVVVIVVAHPTKEVAAEGKLRTPRLYDIEGSATWANKADHGIIVERPGQTAAANIYIQKVRFDATGKRVKMTMEFDPSSAHFRAVGCGLPL